ncbi:HAMP domain-containing histidine kinase [Anaerotignum lactatifermentans]|uniref:histidine kinase n=1 Tax=Anaerotignum lactatifermentans TaxID=160404 RepID=A0ABS2G9W2_9FIRM|nr:HAMP domain-containing sensor histidine kinase [Anaerotignum lactatifermentans]MBM6830373.1 HAMP domain-containing histidine kinase [Anaerotignum lactatifermentans]MBM6878279.1 HAMP domain-containing histidine kinase [Anaerotignum lactatifermentans]MBM6951359.1 HAMP domain-containing histidine kinase [Anaerotignum lactatifermentans]
MRKISIKIKITLWYLLLMLLMMGIVLGFIIAVSNSVASQTAMTQISATVRENLNQISMEDGKLQVGEEFRFYHNGIYTLIYSENKTLLAGQPPLNVTEVGDFENGVTRTVSAGDEDYYIMDLWRSFGWDNGVWVRGITEVPESATIIENLLTMAAIAMPVFILLSTIGGFWIAKRAFRPLEEIISTADSINEGADLSARIPVPEGGNEFGRLVRTFDQMFERLEASFEAEKQFTADASHELRTPISVIKGACEYSLKYDETIEEQRESMEMIQRQAEKMSALVTDLLQMTRLDQGTERANFKEGDLSELVTSVCGEYMLDRLHLDVEEKIVMWMDVSLMTRLLENLITNAIKYGGETGQIWVRLERRGGDIRLSVKDEGIGIPKEQQEKIWQRFYQVDSARSGDSGIGLGLSMVKKIAELHGGRMELESAPGRGSTFTLCISQYCEI